MLLFLFGFFSYFNFIIFYSFFFSRKNSRIHENDFAIKIYKSFAYILEINLKMSKIYKNKMKRERNE